MTREDTRQKTEDARVSNEDLLKKTREMLALLDTDTEQLQQALIALDQLRSLVIKRDDVGLTALLERMRTDQRNTAGHERRRQTLREDLAMILGCPAKDMTLSRLEAALPRDLREAAAAKKRALRTLAEKVRMEYSGTSLLLADCARLNHAMFRVLFQGAKKPPVTYSHTGKARRPSQGHLVSVSS